MKSTSYKPTSLLPKVYPIEEHALDIATAVRVEGISVELQRIKTLANPRTCPVEFLPILAYSFGSDFYWEFEDLSEAQQREMIANSLQLHRKKGTLWAIKKVLDILGFEMELTEWWENKDDPFGINPTEPYTFNLVLDVANFYENSKKVFTEKEQRRILKYLYIYKNVRSHFDMYIKYSSQNDMALPAFADVAEIATEMCESRDFVQATTNAVGAVGISSMRDSALFSLQSVSEKHEPKTEMALASVVSTVELVIEHGETNPKEEVKHEMSIPTLMSLQEVICL